jgi:hypothetical protein
MKKDEYELRKELIEFRHDLKFFSKDAIARQKARKP